MHCLLQWVVLPLPNTYLLYYILCIIIYIKYIIVKIYIITAIEEDGDLGFERAWKGIFEGLKRETGRGEVSFQAFSSSALLCCKDGVGTTLLGAAGDEEQG